MFSIRSVSINLFAFYHAQTFATLLVLIVPLRLACGNGDPHINLLEWIALIVWFVSFLLENIADYQLDQFLKQPSGKPGVCRKGLWKYSRHPNYFFEFLIWVSYSIFAWPSASTVPEYVLLLLVQVRHTGFWSTSPAFQSPKLPREIDVARHMNNMSRKPIASFLGSPSREAPN